MMSASHFLHKMIREVGLENYDLDRDYSYTLGYYRRGSLNYLVQSDSF